MYFRPFTSGPHVTPFITIAGLETRNVHLVEKLRGHSIAGAPQCWNLGFSIMPRDHAAEGSWEQRVERRRGEQRRSWGFLRATKLWGIVDGSSGDGKWWSLDWISCFGDVFLVCFGMMLYFGVSFGVCFFFCVCFFFFFSVWVLFLVRAFVYWSSRFETLESVFVDFFHANLSFSLTHNPPFHGK